MTTIIRAARSSERSTESEGLRLVDLVTPDDGTVHITVQRALLQPGCASTPHYHDRQEVVVFLSGTVTIRYNDTSHTIEAGDIFIVDANTTHHVINEGSDVSDALIYMPAGTKTVYPEEARAEDDTTAAPRSVRPSPLGGYRLAHVRVHDARTS